MSRITNITEGSPTAAELAPLVALDLEIDLMRYVLKRALREQRKSAENDYRGYLYVVKASALRVVQESNGLLINPDVLPPDAQPEAPVPVRAVAPIERRRRKATGIAPAPEAQTPVSGDGDSGKARKARVLAALQKYPLSAMELAGRLGLRPAQVYMTCSTLKGEGQIESRIDDEGDGTRRYFAVGGKS
jgi:hypothetical protein